MLFALLKIGFWIKNNKRIISICFSVNQVDILSLRGSQEFYEVDGLKHCSLCHTPLETWVAFGPVRKKVPCLCQCKTEARDQRDQAFKARQQAERKKQRRASHIQDPALRRMTFEADNGACPAGFRL